MRKSISGAFGLLAGMLAGFCASPVVRADDTEIFFGQTSSEAAPNIMFILDTSGSMDFPVQGSPVAYDPTQTYSGACTTSTIYFKENSQNGTPDCTGNNVAPSISTDDMHCSAADTAFSDAAGSTGWFTDSAARWRVSTSTEYTNCGWEGPWWNRDWECDEEDVTTYQWASSLWSGGNATVSDVACYGDRATAPYPNVDGPSSNADQWTNDSSDSFWVSGQRRNYTFYSGNYLNWYHEHQFGAEQTRMQIMQDAAVSVLSSINGVKVGLMRYSSNGGNGDSSAEGGMVVYPVSPVEDNRDNIVAAVRSYLPEGSTPLSETLFEAYQYFAGGDVVYGDSSRICHPDSINFHNNPVEDPPTCDYGGRIDFPSVASSRVDGDAESEQYASPMEYSCQENYIVYLTDGEPTQDTGANDEIRTLTGAECYNDGGCLEALSGHLHTSDLRPDEEVEGDQTVVTHYIGFGSDVSSGEPFEYLTEAATAGGGRAYPANNLTELINVLNEIVTEATTTNSTFTAASVAVNAFNRTQTLNDLYISVFKPSATRRWSGNMKKYRINDGQIVDVAGQPAVDESTGFIADGARSYWSPADDGGDVAMGGAASRLPDPATRDVYTYLGADNTPSDPVSLTTGHDFTVANVEAALQLGPGDPSAADLVSWVRGEDVKDEYPDRDRRLSMGDPIHAPPAVVIYGGTVDAPESVVFVPTNDGMLHAFAPTNNADPAAESVSELWSFIPQEVLGGLKHLYNNAASSEKHYLLDGEIRVLKYDVDGNGVVESAEGDRVFLFFGQGRGGQRYYALDVTDKNAPEFMWSLGPDELPGLGYAWSTPTIARVNIADADQNSQKLVLIFGGGYDPMEDDNVYHGADNMGNAVYMVDALYGDLLWSGGPDDADNGIDHTLDLAPMSHAIPSAITVMDTNTDGYADRMYVGDLAGQLWRFDIASADNAATELVVENDLDNLVSGGVIASLGAKGLSAPIPASDVRRFYHAPDVAAVQRAGSAPYFAISIGSGYRGRPLSRDADDRFYVIRDTSAFRSLTQGDYEAQTIISDANLTDITSSVTPTIPADSRGWKLRLTNPGEKVLSTAVTFKNQVFFTTYSPANNAAANVCSVGVGTNRAYALSIVDGSPVSDLDGVTGTTAADRSVVLRQAGIAPSVSILFPSPDLVDDDDDEDDGEDEGEPCVGNGCPAEGDEDEDEDEDAPGGGQQGTICLSGVEVLGACADFDSRVKTYWRESGAN